MDNIELARFYDDEKRRLITITVSDYNKLIDSKDKNGIADFIFNRLFSRYIRPYSFDNSEYKEKFKNGFSIMANLCLLIETLQSFKNGWGDSDRKSEKAFKQFFDNNIHFAELSQKGSIIYKNIRCGILHQGETTGGWKITRKGTFFYDSDTNTLDAVLFAERMKMSLNDYRDSLINSEWDSEIWDNFRTKMRKVIQNCRS
jgi:hypothetical protein